jgi:hypothetical protein
MDGPANLTTTNIYCGVVIINAVLGGLNILLATWLANDRRRADSHRRVDHLNSMLQFEQVLKQLQECPLVHVDQKDK